MLKMNGERELHMVSLITRFLKHPVLVILAFIVAAVLCGILSFGVRTNYDMADYLPEDAPSTIGLEVYRQEAGNSLPNARALLKDATLADAQEMKGKLEAIKGVIAVDWLDDIVDLTLPLDALDRDTVEQYYKDGNALYTLTISKDTALDTTVEIRELLGENGALAGSVVDTAEAMSSSAGEVPRIMMFAVPLVLLVLLLTTSSWLEPLLFMVTIGIAIVLNLGTNIIWGQVSFVTATCAAILQFAVSMDYSIFLLHRFAEHRHDGVASTPAMQMAVRGSFSAVSASAMTTIFGFMALIFMEFRIGPDMGWVLAKGILLSMVSVLVLLPALVIVSEKWVEKTKHRLIVRDFNKLAGTFARFQFVILALVILVSVPAFLGQSRTGFLFGASEFYSADTQVGQDRAAIESVFGKANRMVLLVSKGDPARETELTATLEGLLYVDAVVSYGNMVGYEIPPEMLPENRQDQFFTENYSLVYVFSVLDAESNEVFALTAQVRQAAEEVYGAAPVYLVGESVSTYDMKNIITQDNRTVLLLAVLGIGLVLVLTFRNLVLPLLMLLVIESAIWINLSIPYFTDTKLVYIAYLILSAIQLGATVDYAILFGTRYMDYRSRHPKKEALLLTGKASMTSIVTSASILAISGFCLGYISTNFAISQIGILIGRGALLSAGTVLFALPALLYLLDGLVRRSSLKFRKEGTS